ncbi:YecA family protein [Allosphingosinicella humi]
MADAGNKTVRKSKGVTPTERYLAELCERSFLKLWSYPNPFKEDEKELCDLIAVFDEHVLIFFDRESHRLRNLDRNITIEWPRWRREVVDKQIRTSYGAARYISSGRPIYLDSRREVPFPLRLSAKSRIHKIVVAHGAMEACRAYSSDNVSGSLAIAYGPPKTAELDEPFFLDLDRTDPVHVFDSENLGIVLTELDTIYDFVAYLKAKEDAINRHDFITYCGEEDLVAHYLLNYNADTKKHWIGAEDDISFVHIGEGEYEGFRNSPPYRRRQEANRNSYAWDKLIQITSENALNGTLSGNGDPFKGRSAIHFMAKEPRFVRRALSDQIANAIRSFPENDAPIMRNLTLLPSYYEGTAYVFLQLKVKDQGDYDTEYRPRRAALLEIACAAAKLKRPGLERVIGIAIDAPKYSEINSEDLLLMEFDQWDKKKAQRYQALNEQLGFFKTGKEWRATISELPPPHERAGPRKKTGRIDPCPCGSGNKFKKCHGR